MIDLEIFLNPDIKIWPLISINILKCENLSGHFESNLLTIRAQEWFHAHSERHPWGGQFCWNPCTLRALQFRAKFPCNNSLHIEPGRKIWLHKWFRFLDGRIFELLQIIHWKKEKNYKTGFLSRLTFEIHRPTF